MLVLAATFADDRVVYRIVRTPSIAEQDGRRPHREHEYLFQERVRIENRIASLLATQRVPKRRSSRSWAAELEALRSGDGRPLPPRLKAELDRLRRRLMLTLDMIREVEAERDYAIGTDNSAINEKVGTLCQRRGVGGGQPSINYRRAKTALDRRTLM